MVLVCESAERPAYLGRHIIAEFFHADFHALNDADPLEEAMINAATAAGATVISSHKHFFSPHGVSAVIIVQESNLCIHTWPEFGYAAADFFTCGDSVNPWRSFEFLRKYLKAEKFNCMELKRGNTELLKDPSILEENVTCASFVGEPTTKMIKYEAGMDINISVSDKEIVNLESRHQKVVISHNKYWGNILWLDGVANVRERDEFVYHEMITHVPMMTHPKPKRVLIVGGGDGGAAREILKHPGLEKVVVIDIDEDVVNECKKHMPSVSSGAFDDPRLELLIGDGIDYVKRQQANSFDVIVVDSTDPRPESVSEVLFTREFYENCHRIMAAEGVMSTRSVMPTSYDAEVYRTCRKNILSVFRKECVLVYLIPTDTYQGQTCLTLVVQAEDAPSNVSKDRIDRFEVNQKLKYYNHRVHAAAFCLPNYLKEIVS